MQAIFTIIGILASLMTGGFVDESAGGSEFDPFGATSSSQAEEESEGGPGADPWG